MIIVSDTTPIHYLILVNEESILPAIFDRIIVPDAVLTEMRHKNAPRSVRQWMEDLPDWVVVKTAASEMLEGITGLGKGETAAIAIAITEKADAVLMDDRKAIREARKNGLTALTTFAVLELASIKGLIDLKEVLEKLSQTSFRMPPEEIIEEYLRRDTMRNS